MSHGVLDQCLQEQGRDDDVVERIVDVPFDTQPVAEPDRLDVEVAPDEVSSSDNGTRSGVSWARTSRRRSLKSETMRTASSRSPVRTSAPTECSALNRKCGWIRARIASSCARASCSPSRAVAASRSPRRRAKSRAAPAAAVTRAADHRAERDPTDGGPQGARPERRGRLASTEHRDRRRIDDAMQRDRDENAEQVHRDVSWRNRKPVEWKPRA